MCVAEIAATELIEEMEHPRSEGVEGIAPDCPVAILVRAGHGAAVSLITALRRKGIHAVKGTTAELAPVRVYTERESLLAFHWAVQVGRQKGARVLRAAI